MTEAQIAAAPGLDWALLVLGPAAGLLAAYLLAARRRLRRLMREAGHAREAAALGTRLLAAMQRR